MADIRDGSLKDTTLNNALAFDDNASVSRTIDIDLLDDGFKFTYLSPSSRKTITAGEIKKANTSGTTEIEEGEIKDESGKIYFLFFNEDNILELILTGEVLQTVINETVNIGNATLTFNGYRIYLSMLVNALEKISYYSSLTAKLHRESVQDAVDAVQSKRLDFAETKDEEIDVIGIFSTVLTLFVFEAGIASMIFQKLSVLLTRLSSKTYIRKALNVFFAFVGGKSGRSTVTPRIKELESEIIRLQAKSKKLNEDAAKAIFDTEKAARKALPDKDEVSRLNNIALILQRKSSSALTAKETAESEKNLLNARVRDELIILGKEEVDNLLLLAKETAEKNTQFIQGKTAEKLAGAIKGGGSDKPVEVPIDVYFKTSIQNLYEENVLFYGRIILLAKDLLNNFEISGLSNDETVNLHLEVLELLPSLQDIENSINEYEEIFGTEFNYGLSKEIQSEEYEFMIWCLLLRNKIRPFVTAHKQDVLSIARLFMNEEQIKNLPANKNTIAIKESMAKYISRRFNLRKDLSGDSLNIEIATVMVSVITKLDNIMGQVNEIVKSSEQKYRADITSRKKIE